MTASIRPDHHDVQVLHDDELHTNTSINDDSDIPRRPARAPKSSALPRLATGEADTTIQRKVRDRDGRDLRHHARYPLHTPGGLPDDAPSFSTAYPYNASPLHPAREAPTATPRLTTLSQTSTTRHLSTRSSRGTLLHNTINMHTAIGITLRKLTRQAGEDLGNLAKTPCAHRLRHRPFSADIDIDHNTHLAHNEINTRYPLTF